MKSSRVTRPAAIAIVLASLVPGVIASIAPPASAEGEVAVTWPEVTAFDPDVADYLVDIAWDGSGSLWLGHAETAGASTTLLTRSTAARDLT